MRNRWVHAAAVGTLVVLLVLLAAYTLWAATRPTEQWQRDYRPPASVPASRAPEPGA